MILVLAFAVRLAHWIAVRGLPFVAQLVVDSKEYDAWARQIAAGDWLGSRVFFQAPLYPYLVAVIYKISGGATGAVYLFQIALAVAGVWALARAGRLMGGEIAGLFAAGLAAVYGPFVFYDVQLMKESPAVTVVCFLLWALAAARARPSARAWTVAGLLLGTLALLRENALLATPFLALLTLAPNAPRGTIARRAGAFVLGAALPLVPVAIRNGVVGGEFLPTTSQGGANFYIGNNASADGTYRPIVPGRQIPTLERQESIRVAEVATGRKLSAGEASSYWLHRGLAWARSNPWACVKLQGRKLGMYWSWYEWPDAVDYYWIGARSPVFRLPLVEFGTISLLAVAGVGLMLRRRLASPLAPAWTLASIWMLSTIAFFLFSRYRLPGVPPLMILGALPCAAVVEARAAGDKRWWWGAALVLLAWAVSLVPAGKPRNDLVEFNLGRLADEQGDAAAAGRHYEAALAADPKAFLPCLNLGTLAAQRGDWTAALSYYRRAAELEPRSDDAHSDLGGVLLATGDADGAEKELDRALELNARNLPALQNKVVLLLRRGDLDGARAADRRLLELDPENPAGARLRDRIDAAASAPKP